MAKIGDVWDSTTDALAGRARLIAPVAALALFLPAVVTAAFAAFAARPGAGMGGGMGGGATLLTVAFAVVALWGRLTIVAVALDPDTDGAAARGQATRLLLPLIGALLVLGAAGIVLILPLVAVLTRAGLDWTAVAASGRVRLPELGGGAMWFARFYVLALAALGLWVIARVKLLLAPVVLAERRTIGAIGRAVALSRGMTWRLIGVVILYYVVLWVSVLAVTWVMGTVLRLALPGDARATATFVATIAGAVVGTSLDVVSQVFQARLFVALGGDGGAGAARTAA